VVILQRNIGSNGPLRNEMNGEDTGSNMSYALIIPAAGGGSRSGQQIPKQYVELLGRPILAHTLHAFADVAGCSEIVVAVSEEWRGAAEEAAAGIAGVRFVPGGTERQHSIASALAALRTAPDLVLVHDAARPAVSRALIERVIAAASQHGAAIPALPINETVKRVNADGVIVETIPRAELRAAQTPQGFRRELLVAAYDDATTHSLAVTDDASLVEAYGAAVHVVEGDWENIKVTMPDDFRRAEEVLRGRGGG
jgi:2-C-methyl-D-erythritol 4-phosphate cytidylyltransferase